jgi:hypothetical protein
MVVFVFEAGLGANSLSPLIDGESFQQFLVATAGRHFSFYISSKRNLSKLFEACAN